MLLIIQHSRNIYNKKHLIRISLALGRQILHLYSLQTLFTIYGLDMALTFIAMNYYADTARCPLPW